MSIIKDRIESLSKLLETLEHPSDIRSLMKEFNLSSNAVRARLVALERMKLVQRESRPPTKGGDLWQKLGDGVLPANPPSIRRAEEQSKKKQKMKLLENQYRNDLPAHAVPPNRINKMEGFYIPTTQVNARENSHIAYLIPSKGLSV